MEVIRNCQWTSNETLSAKGFGGDSFHTAGHTKSQVNFQWKLNWWGIFSHGRSYEIANELLMKIDPPWDLVGILITRQVIRNCQSTSNENLSAKGIWWGNRGFFLTWQVIRNFQSTSNENIYPPRGICCRICMENHQTRSLKSTHLESVSSWWSGRNLPNHQTANTKCTRKAFGIICFIRALFTKNEDSVALPWSMFW